MIEIIGVTKRYGATAVVDNVTLNLPKGGITSIIGPNGAGKSTLLSIISRLTGMDAGQVMVDGHDIATTPGDQMAKRIAILRQDNHLTARLTVQDLVTFGRYPHSKGRPTIEDRRHIDNAIDYMQLDAFRTRFLNELSGGQRQRAFVAMILCQDTDYLLLDEPLNSLDMRHAAGMMHLLERIVKELGKTVVLVLHDINFASCYSHQIVAMRDGRVAHQGTPDEIMRPEILRDIYEMDVRIEEIDGRRIGLFYN